MSENIGRILPIGDGSNYRIRCINETKYSSKWILEEFIKRKFLWWEWEEWDTLIFTTNYGAGDTTHECVFKKRHEEPDIDVIYQAEGELDFLGLEYE
jgi:hypothetical protein